MSEDKIMLCSRCEDGAPACPANAVKCQWCGHDVWIAHGSQKAATDLSAKIKCLQCHAKWLNETKHPMDETVYQALTTSEEWKEFMEQASNEWEGH